MVDYSNYSDDELVNMINDRLSNGTTVDPKMILEIRSDEKLREAVIAIYGFIIDSRDSSDYANYKAVAYGLACIKNDQEKDRLLTDIAEDLHLVEYKLCDEDGNRIPNLNLLGIVLASIQDNEIFLRWTNTTNFNYTTIRPQDLIEEYRGFFEKETGKKLVIEEHDATKNPDQDTEVQAQGTDANETTSSEEIEASETDNAISLENMEEYKSYKRLFEEIQTLRYSKKIERLYPFVRDLVYSIAKIEDEELKEQLTLQLKTELENEGFKLEDWINIEGNSIPLIGIICASFSNAHTREQWAKQYNLPANYMQLADESYFENRGEHLLSEKQSDDLEENLAVSANSHAYTGEEHVVARRQTVQETQNTGTARQNAQETERPQENDNYDGMLPDQLLDEANRISQLIDKTKANIASNSEIYASIQGQMAEYVRRLLGILRQLEEIKQISESELEDARVACAKIDLLIK